MSRRVGIAEVAAHASRDDCWVVIHGKVYDLTTFLDAHPGGSKVIMAQAGKDATAAFDPFHPGGIIERMGLERLCVGTLDAATVAASGAADGSGSGAGAGSDADAGAATGFKKPPLSHMLNLFDYEEVAKHTMTEQGWAYYSSGADDEVTLRENHAAFQRVWLRPRVLVNVSSIDMTTQFLGCPTSFPVYITATALGKLADPEGELALTRAAHKSQVVYMFPTLSSYSLDEMLAARAPGQDTFVQLYVNGDREVTRRYVEQAERGGCRALCITVDAPQLGRREKDMRHRFTLQGTDVQADEDGDEKGVDRSQGTARAISSFIDPSLCWDDLPWFKSITSMKIVLKGIQTGEDAVLAARAGVDALIVSNHGGRQIDYARSGIEILPEVMAALRSEGADRRIEVYVDGGVRRGTDIYKALALGARGVGIGRPALYSLAAYGQKGVERMLAMLKEELLFTMRLMGTPRIADITPDTVSARNISDHFVPQPKDHLSDSTYVPLSSKL